MNQYTLLTSKERIFISQVDEELVIMTEYVLVWWVLFLWIRSILINGSFFLEEWVMYDAGYMLTFVVGDHFVLCLWVDYDYNIIWKKS